MPYSSTKGRFLEKCPKSDKVRKEKYRTILVPNKKYKYVWDNSSHEKAPKQRSDNAIITYMSAVRAYWLWCIDMGYTQNNPFRKYTVGSQKYGTPYYLTTEERDILFKTNLKSKKEVELARDIFVFPDFINASPNFSQPVIRLDEVSNVALLL